MFARAEGIIPAPESNHAIRVAIDEALACKRTGERKTIFFNLSGHGHFDMAAYDRYLQRPARRQPVSRRSDKGGAGGASQGRPAAS